MTINHAPEQLIFFLSQNGIIKFCLILLRWLAKQRYRRMNVSWTGIVLVDRGIKFKSQNRTTLKCIVL